MVLKEKNRKLNTFLVAILMLVSLIVFSGCSNGKEKDEQYTTIEDIEFTGAVIEKNNNIYLYDESYSYLEPIGELSRLKEMTASSEGSAYIAFKYVDENNKINIYDVKNMETRVLEIEEQGEISFLQWYKDLLVVGIYENPTTNKYLVYDKDLKLVNSCNGILIDVLEEGKTLVYGANKQGVTSIYVNDENIYTLEKTGEILLGGKVSPDQKEISFITFVFDRKTFEQKEFLYTAKFKNKKLKDIEILDKPYEIYGEVRYDGNKLAIVNQEEYIEVIDDKFVIKNLTEINASINDNSNKLKEILGNTFKSEIKDVNKSWTELGIKNITWFTR